MSVSFEDSLFWDEIDAAKKYSGPNKWHPLNGKVYWDNTTHEIMIFGGGGYWTTRLWEKWDGKTSRRVEVASWLSHSLREAHGKVNEMVHAHWELLHPQESS